MKEDTTPSSLCYYQENSPEIFGDHNLIEKITFLNNSYETHSRNFHNKKSQCSSSTKTGLKKEIEKDPFFKNIDRVDNFLMNSIEILEEHSKVIDVQFQKLIESFDDLAVRVGDFVERYENQIYKDWMEFRKELGLDKSPIEKGFYEIEMGGGKEMRVRRSSDEYYEYEYNDYSQYEDETNEESEPVETAIPHDGRNWRKSSLFQVFDCYTNIFEIILI